MLNKIRVKICSKGAVFMIWQIRPMHDNDWPEVSRIYQQGIDTNLATFEVCCPPFDVWHNNHLPVSRLVIVSGSTLAGWAAVSPVSGRPVYSGVAEASLYIDEKYRGQGLGQRLLNELIASTEKNGVWTLQSVILAENEASIHLHEKGGFRMVGWREKIGRDRFGNWRNTVLMERRSALF